MTSFKSLPPNYFLRHWRGELSLPVSYWINANILVGIITVILFVAATAIMNRDPGLRVASFVGLSTLVFSIMAGLWSMVGVWRSAGHHVEKGGKARWANAARGVVVLAFIGMAANLVITTIPQVREFGLIAIGNDPIGDVDVTVSSNGESVVVSGTLREGSAEKIISILEATPGVASVVLNSNGGRLFEAQQLAHAVRNRKLDTYVEGICESACTYIFLAGKDRAATPNAKIGFHQPSFPGTDTTSQRIMTQDMLAIYKAAGLPEAFMQRIEKTAPQDMWHPTRDELIKSNVITRVSLGGEAAIIGSSIRSRDELVLIVKSTPLFRIIEERFPGSRDKVVERVWEVKERGGSDAELINAGRTVVSEIVPQLLKTADDNTLDRFGKLFIDQLSAAQALGGEACSRWMEGKLDVTKVFPEELIEQDHQFLLSALMAPDRTPDPADAAKAVKAIQAAVLKLPQEYISVLAKPQDFANRPELVCSATLAFMQNILALPAEQRLPSLRSMY